jgi:hypothetical protein
VHAAVLQIKTIQPNSGHQGALRRPITAARSTIKSRRYRNKRARAAYFRHARESARESERARRRGHKNLQTRQKRARSIQPASHPASEPLPSLPASAVPLSKSRGPPARPPLVLTGCVQRSRTLKEQNAPKSNMKNSHRVEKDQETKDAALHPEAAGGGGQGAAVAGDAAAGHHQYARRP